MPAPLLSSFFSPCGRIGIGGFWWRQLLLALPLYLCLYHAHYSFERMFDLGNAGISALPLLLAQACPPAFASAGLGVGSATFRFTVEWENIHLYQYSPTGWEMQPGLTATLCLLAASLLAWCSFALVLRRLRDTRPGLWPLPLCLAALWWYGAGFLGYRWDWLRDILFALPLIASFIFTCLPSHRPGSASTVNS